MEYPQDTPSLKNFSHFAAVVLELAIDKTLDYGIPEALLSTLRKGSLVQVPLRGVLRKGIVLEVKQSCDYPKVLPVHKVLSDDGLLTDDLLELALWISKYYCTPLSRTLKVILPPSVRKQISPKQQCFVTRLKTKEEINELCCQLREKQPQQAAVLDIMLQVKKGILLTELLEKAEVTRSPVATLTKRGVIKVQAMRTSLSPLVDEEYFKTAPKILTEEQSAALERINASLTQGVFETHLLFGVTGSGKTEVYLRAIEKALSLGRGTILLVPEIALTTQTMERFKSRFDEKIAVLHHRLSQGERFDEWHRMKKGEVMIALGARSALFSPIQNLGLIIVDEEHDSAYKQNDEMPCYHARDVAVMRAKQSGCPVVLGSATPSLESYHNAVYGKYTLSVLSLRTENAQMPPVTIVDMRKEFEKNRGFTLFSQKLLEAIKHRFALGEQTILFLNRRGYHTTLLCKECSFVMRCPHCEIPLTFHLSENVLACHLCPYKITPVPHICPQCKQGETLKWRGVGTELVERSLKAILPEVRTLRIDADTTRHKGSHDMLLRSFSTGKSDVLIGTQMVAKGLHFPLVTLVAVLNCDSALNLPDFRASESIFQLITQVSGRAGRAELKGEVIVQTQMTENETIKLATQANFEAFYTQEIASRQAFSYPPFTRFVKFLFSGPHCNAVFALAKEMRTHFLPLSAKGYHIHPALPAGHPKINDNYRFQFFVRGKAIHPIKECLEQALQKTKVPSTIRFVVDVDPLSTFF